MATRTNTLAVQVVAYGKANKELDDVARAFKAMKGETYILENEIPKAAAKTSSGLTAIKAAGAAAATGIAAFAIGAAASAVAIDAAVTGAFSLAKASADLGDKAVDAAQRVGTTTEFISRMGFAAKQNATSIETVERGLKKLAQGALSGSKTFDRWGVSIKNSDGTLKSTEQLYVAAAAKISSLENNATRAAAAQDLFGRTGTEMIPLLSLTTAEMDALNATADRLGITIDARSAQLASNFNDALDATTDAFTAVSREAGAVFQPAMTEAFKAGADVAALMLGTIAENREAFEAFATKSVALLAQGFALVVEAGSAASHVVEGIASVFTFRLGPAFDGARQLAGEVAARARDLARDLEDGAAVTRDEVIPSVNAENTARSDLLSTLGKEKKERQSLLEISEKAAFELADAETELQRAIEDTGKKGSLAAARDATLRRINAEERARIELEAARTIEAQTLQSAAAIEGLEAELAAKRAAIRGEDTQRALRETEVVVTGRGEILTEHHEQILALLDKESGARKLTAFEVAEEEIRQTQRVLAAAKKAHQERIEDLNEAKTVVQGATKEFVDAKSEEERAQDAAAQEISRARERDKRAKERTDREALRRMRAEARAQKEAREQAIATAQSIAGAAQDAAGSMISVFRSMRDQSATTEDVLFSLGQMFIDTSTQIIGAIQQQLATKQAAATGEITANAATAGSNVARSASEELPWFIALAVAPAVAATMFGLIKAFAGKYHTGGDIPGPLGQERLALVQAGERVVSIQERRAEQRSAGGGGTPSPTLNVQLVSQSLVPLQTRSAYDNTYRGPLKRSLQGLNDSNQVRVRKNSRVVRRKRAA